MPSLDQILGDLSLGSLLSAMIQGAVIAGILRVAMWLFNVAPKSERLYWPVGAVLVALTILVITGIARYEPKPDFSRTTIDINTLGECKPKDSNGEVVTCITMGVSFRNTGDEGSIDSWMVELLTLDGKAIRGQFIEYPVTVITKKGEELLLVPNPIVPSIQVVRGRIVTGKFAAFFNIARERAQLPGNRLRLSFSDAFGKRYPVDGPVITSTTAPL